MRPQPAHIADELKQFHEGEAAKLRAAIASASIEQKVYMEKALKLHEEQIKSANGIN